MFGEQISDTKSKVGNNTINFDINKNMQKEDYSRFKNILENGLKINNNNNYLKINVKSFFTPRDVESIYDQKLTGKNIGNSLLSHIILSGNKNRNNKNMDNPINNFIGV